MLLFDTPFKTPCKQGRRLNLYQVITVNAKCFEKKAGEKKIFSPLKKNMKSHKDFANHNF